jgi:3-deoxy-D-manno-octulosonic-acid transferase
VITILYTLFIKIYHLAMHLAALWNVKAKLWVEGRKDFFASLNATLQNIPDKTNRIWMHVSSLGEFEQGIPLIEDLKNKYPDCYIIVSFFSPSGYEPAKNYTGVDLICYLPVDTLANAKKFIAYINPTLVLWIIRGFPMVSASTRSASGRSKTAEYCHINKSLGGGSRLFASIVP